MAHLTVTARVLEAAARRRTNDFAYMLYILMCVVKLQKSCV